MRPGVMRWFAVLFVCLCVCLIMSEAESRRRMFSLKKKPEPKPVDEVVPLSSAVVACVATHCGSFCTKFEQLTTPLFNAFTVFRDTLFHIRSDRLKHYKQLDPKPTAEFLAAVRQAVVDQLGSLIGTATHVNRMLALYHKYENDSDNRVSDTEITLLSKDIKNEPGTTLLAITLSDFEKGQVSLTAVMESYKSETHPKKYQDQLDKAFNTFSGACVTANGLLKAALADLKLLLSGAENKEVLNTEQLLNRRYSQRVNKVEAWRQLMKATQDKLLQIVDYINQKASSAFDTAKHLSEEAVKVSKDEKDVFNQMLESVYILSHRFDVLAHQLAPSLTKVADKIGLAIGNFKVGLKGSRRSKLPVLATARATLWNLFVRGTDELEFPPTGGETCRPFLSCYLQLPGGKECKYLVESDQELNPSPLTHLKTANDALAEQYKKFLKISPVEELDPDYIPLSSQLPGIFFSDVESVEVPSQKETREMSKPHKPKHERVLDGGILVAQTAALAAVVDALAFPDCFSEHDFRAVLQAAVTQNLGGCSDIDALVGAAYAWNWESNTTLEDETDSDIVSKKLYGSLQKKKRRLFLRRRRD